MKTVLTFLLLLAFNTFAQDVTVLGRIYIDTAVMSPTEYTTCDTTKTLRIMTDNDLSNIASDRLSKMYSLSNDYDNEFLNGGFDFCKKVDGKHPPCGRPDTDKGAYPKCRAAGVAGKMSDADKKSACQQKRRAEKKDTQTGKGQKPIMTSYKPKNKKTQNESLDVVIKNILSGL